MKKFSLLLMIVLIVGAIFVSCSAEPARSSDVATVALSLDIAKGLNVSSVADADQALPQVENLYWYYTATKTGGFQTGATTTPKPVRSDNEGKGLPGLIGQTATGVGQLFSTGTWTFSFFGYQGRNTDGSPAGNLVYSGSDEVDVQYPEGTDMIGGRAEITLGLVNDTRTYGTVKIQNITVDFGHAIDSSAYTLTVTASGISNPIATSVVSGSNASNGTITFFSEATTINVSNTTSSDVIAPRFYTLSFAVTKAGDSSNTYASGEITIHARLGYNVTIDGSLNKLESVAYVQIHNNTQGLPQAQNENVFTISTEAELRAFAAYVNQGNNCAGLTIKLTDDITLSQPWTPIGNSYRGQENGAYFAGTFDGSKPNDSGNYTISGLTDGNNYVPANAKGNGEYSYGLFGIVKNATIKNINLTNVNIKSNNASYTADEVGAVVGYSLGSLTLDNITVSGSVVGDNVGGIIGRAYGTSAENETIDISDCTNEATVSSLHIHNSGANSYTDRAAGIAGYINGKGTPVTVENCINSGDITVGSANAVGTNYIAGICCYGFNTNVADSYTFKNNKSTGDLTVLGTSGTAHVAIIVYMCNEPKQNNDAYNFTDASENYEVTITVFGTPRTDVLKETH